jgi:hypothetical protein
MGLHCEQKPPTMKKNYVLHQVILAMLCLASINVNSQALSGLYTINSAQATGGTNFQTFTDFATAINTNGISGTVTVNVDPGSGPYNEQVTFSQITGASAANRVTINGNGRLLYFNSANSAAPHTMLLNGTDFFSVNNLEVEGQGTTYAMACVLTNAANFNTFGECVFRAPVNGTSSYHVPLSITGNATSPTTSGGGEFNTVTSCTMMNGYYGITAYGITSAPYTQGNRFESCRVTDFYTYGMYFPYSKNYTIKNCTFDRVTRTSSSTVYGWYGYNSQGGMFDGNKFHKFFDAQQGSSSSCYIAYNYGNPISNGPRNTYRNNIVTDIKNNGTVYGFYLYNSGSDIYNNTLDFDYAGATSANTIYGMYPYGSATNPNTIINNIITIRRGASGSNRYGLYIATTGNITVDRNDIHVVNASGSNNIGYYNGAHVTLASWQAAGMDPTGFDLDPTYTSATDLHPTNTPLNNQGMVNGLAFDQELAVRHPSTPDIGALEFLTPLCTGTPSMTVAGPNFSVCPGESANMSIGNLSSDLGYTYQWRWSTTSVVGPFTVIPGASSIYYSTPGITATSWFSAIITCTAPGGGTIMPVAQVNVAATTTNTVPYNEDFENIGLPDRLPNCSWYTPALGTAAKTYTSAAPNNLVPRSGNSFAAFANLGSGTNHFYTNGIWLDAGVTYSASMWYQTDLSGSTNWSSLSVLYGTAQTPTGLTTIAAVSPAVSAFHKSLSSTFTVASSGLYYVAIQAVNNSGGAPYLAWDDLSIIIPCTPTLNTPVLSLSVNNSTLCSGQPLILTAAGADTYTWSTGANGSAITTFPFTSNTYYVAGSNQLTGCIATASTVVTVLQSPNVSAFALPPAVCSGKSTNLQASGAISYTWSNGSQGPVISVLPTGNTLYGVMGTAANGCVGTNTVPVAVNALPGVLGTASNMQPCAGEELVLTATGALNYLWVSATPGIVLQGALTTVVLPVSATFTLTGTDANGCSNSQVLNFTVETCNGISNYGAAGVYNVYPNPNSGIFTVTVSKGDSRMIVRDLTGRTIAAIESSESQRRINLTGFASGIYILEVETAEGIFAERIIKE